MLTSENQPCRCSQTWRTEAAACPGLSLVSCVFGVRVWFLCPHPSPPPPTPLGFWRAEQTVVSVLMRRSQLWKETKKSKVKRHDFPLMNCDHSHKTPLAAHLARPWSQMVMKSLSMSFIYSCLHRPCCQRLIVHREPLSHRVYRNFFSFFFVHTRSSVSRTL